MSDRDFETLVRDISLGVIIAAVLIVGFLIMAARADRRPRDDDDKKDGPKP